MHNHASNWRGDVRCGVQAVPLFLIVLFVVAGAAPAAARPWCSHMGSATNCGFDTHAQCLANVSGTSGNCVPNPAARPAPAQQRSEPPRRPAAERPRRERATPRERPAPPAPPPAASVAPPAVAAPAASAKPANPYQAARQLVLDGRYQEGIAALQALGFDDHPDVATYLGLASRKLGRVDAAKAWYAKALAADPDHVLTLLHAGALLAELGDVAGAQRHLARLKAACPDACPEARQLEQVIAARAK